METLNYLIIGCISVIGASMAINIFLDEEDKKKYNKLKTYIIFFIIGIITHLFTQTINLDAIYCNKKCQLRIKNLS